MAIKEQMELFELGGLADEGGTKDPVSGNDVPVGSTQKEVRDDIPAQLSEGEFVLPADVVRYHGLEKIMQLRDEAKQGLQKMEDMGQMGNSEEAILDDDVPFSLEDLDMEDVPEYNVGGVVQQQGFTGVGGYNPSQFTGYTPQYTQYQAPNVPTTYQMPQQQFVPTVPVGQPAPTFGQLFEGKAPTTGELDNREYINSETGEKRVFTFIGGTPSVPIPSGFVPVSEYKPTTIATATPTLTSTTAKVLQKDDDGVEDKAEMFGKNKDTLKSDAYTTAVKSLAGYQLGSLSPTSAVVSEIKNLLGEDVKPQPSSNDFAVAMNLTRENFADSVGKDISELTVDDLNNLGTAMQTVEQVVKDLGPDVVNDEERRNNMIRAAVEASKEDPAETAAKIQAARDRQAERDRQALAAMEAREREAREREAREAQERFYPQRDDNNDDNRGSGTSISEISGVSSGGGSSRHGDFNTTGTGRGRQGYSKGGDVTKQMKKSGLTSKK